MLVAGENLLGLKHFIRYELVLNLLRVGLVPRAYARIASREWTAPGARCDVHHLNPSAVGAVRS